MLSWPATYLGGAVIAITAGLLLITGTRGAACPDNPTEFASRVNELNKTFADVYAGNMQTIEACQSLDCERPEKLEIASALRSNSVGLQKICWPRKRTAAVDALVNANAGMANAYTNWSEVTSPEDDQLLARAAASAGQRQRSALTALTASLALSGRTPNSDRTP